MMDIRPKDHRTRSPRGHLFWLLGALFLSFAITWLFSATFDFSREWFVASYVVFGGGLLYGYGRWSGIALLHHVRAHWKRGVLGAVVAGAFVVQNVLSQPASHRPEGVDLAFALLWLGAVYGVLDAALLSVLPVVAVWRSLTGSKYGKVARGPLALAASAAVTASYHLGFTEFRGVAVAGPVLGNAILTLAYLVSSNPLAAVLAHVAMHVAAVLHGAESTIQLPPH